MFFFSTTSGGGDECEDEREIEVCFDSCFLDTYARCVQSISCDVPLKDGKILCENVPECDCDSVEQCEENKGVCLNDLTRRYGGCSEKEIREKIDAELNGCTYGHGLAGIVDRIEQCVAGLFTEYGVTDPTGKDRKRMDKLVEGMIKKCEEDKKKCEKEEETCKNNVADCNSALEEYGGLEKCVTDFQNCVNPEREREICEAKVKIECYDEAWETCLRDCVEMILNCPAR